MKKKPVSGPAPLQLEELNTRQIQDLLPKSPLLFFPVGTLEPHGRHLPIGTDTMLARGVANELARRCGGVVAPALPFGLTNLLIQTPVATGYPESLFEEFVGVTLRSFYQGGFQRIVLVNGHGGNRNALLNISRAFVRERAVGLCVIHWWLLAEPVAKAVYGETGGHAAVEETAAMLFFHPQLVSRKDYVSETDDFVPESGIWCYPPPGEVLLYEGKGKGRPQFSGSKAERFMADVLTEIEERLRRWVIGLKRLQGGTRPPA